MRCNAIQLIRLVIHSLQVTEVFEEFLASQAQGQSDAVRILDALDLRYFTPEELLRIFDFNVPGKEPVFIWPPNISNKTKYRLIGNSVNVRVVEMLIRYLFSVSYT